MIIPWIKIKKSKKFSLTKLTFPVNCGDDVMMCVMVVFGGGCDTIMVGVDCTTWTRLELLVSVGEIQVLIGFTEMKIYGDC